MSINGTADSGRGERKATLGSPDCMCFRQSSALLGQENGWTMWPVPLVQFKVLCSFPGGRGTLGGRLIPKVMKSNFEIHSCHLFYSF